MHRRTRHLVVLAVAILTASIASYGVYRVMVSMPRNSANAQQPVVVAARAMVIGTPLTERDVKVVPWPAANVVPGSIRTVKEVVGRGLLAGVLQNEPLTENKLAPSSSGAGLPPAIPPGMRALAVKVNEVIGVAGFVVPGSRVDVVATIRHGEEGVTTTVAENVQVLTAGTRQDQEKPSAESKATASTVVTLIVSPKDAERIALAQSEGQLMLSMRNPNDTQPSLTDGVRTAALIGRPETPAPVVTPKPPAPRRIVVAPQPAPEPEKPAPKPTVETIRAQKRSEEVIR
jgi:pilus assembly protein CpaB